LDCRAHPSPTSKSAVKNYCCITIYRLAQALKFDSIENYFRRSLETREHHDSVLNLPVGELSFATIGAGHASGERNDVTKPRGVTNVTKARQENAALEASNVLAQYPITNPPSPLIALREAWVLPCNSLLLMHDYPARLHQRRRARYCDQRHTSSQSSEIFRSRMK